MPCLQNIIDILIWWTISCRLLLLLLYDELSSPFFVYLQERASAEAENKPLPPPRSSSDVRSLRMNDFKHAHEQVMLLLLLSFFRKRKWGKGKNKKRLRLLQDLMSQNSQFLINVSMVFISISNITYNCCLQP